MVSLSSCVEYCDRRVNRLAIKDFPGAVNGLQVANDGSVTKIGATVDAGEVPIAMAIAEGVDFLIVHHGLFWDPPIPVTGAKFRKLKNLLTHGCALYSAHLPLDAHPEIGNNALLAKELGLKAEGTFLPYEGNDIGLIARGTTSRSSLRENLEKLFPQGVTAMEFGPSELTTIGILTGSGTSAIDSLPATGISTFITGELKQNTFTQAQELGLNLYCAGHYATETFGVRALARELGEKFNLPHLFLDTGCPL